MLKLSDLRKTTRRTVNAEVRTVYPHFLRDRTLAPRIEMAVRYMERNLGRPRREMDAEMVVHLFGDHKLARCIVACLASTYRYRPRTFAEMLPREQVDALARLDITNASELRLWIFRRVNATLPGFAGGIERATFVRSAADALGIGPDELERLMTLDAPEQAILVRTGPVPSADDVIARYNYDVAAALLANAPVVRIALSQLPANPAAVLALCAEMGVHADLTRRELVLQGRQDMLESWARHGARLVRALSWLLASGLHARSGEALVAAPTGGEWRFRLDEEILTFLGGTSAPMFALGDLLDATRRLDALLADFAALRRAGRDDGWALRRVSEPLVLAGGVVPVYAAGMRNGKRVVLVPAPSAGEGAQRLADVTPEVPVACVHMLPEVGGEQRSQQDSALPLVEYARRGDLAALPDALAEAVGETERSASRARMDAVLAEARTAGMLAEARLAELLVCTEDEVPLLFGAPEAQAQWSARGLQYIEGFGLCTDDVVRRARAATEGLDGLLTRQDGAARRMRVLGQRLREMTGAREGIECLLAYLGAA